jgi:hypothetical protein
VESSLTYSAHLSNDRLHDEVADPLADGDSTATASDSMTHDIAVCHRMWEEKTMKCQRLSSRFAMLVSGFVVFSATLGALSSSSGLIAQDATMEFAAPRGTPVTTGAGADVVVFTGKPIGTMETSGDCGGGHTNVPVQNVVAIHPGSGHSNHFTVILASQSEPTPPGTRLTDLEILGICTISGSLYDKYRGRVN